MHDKVTVIHYRNIWFRILSLVLGCGLFCVAWYIRKRHLLGWKLFFVVQILCWVGFVIAGTEGVARGYREHRLIDEILFGCFLALLTSPVVGYWCWRWRKEKDNFKSRDE